MSCIEGLNPTTKTLIKYKEIWIEQLRYKKVKLEEMIERGRQIMDNDIFEKDQRNFYRRIENNTKYEGKHQKWISSLTFRVEYGKKTKRCLWYHGWKRRGRH